MAGALGFSKEWSFTYWVLRVNDGCAASSAMSGSSCHGRAWLSRIARPNNRGSGQWRVGRPASVGGRHGTDAGVEAQRDAIADRLAGQPANEAPVAHHQQAVPGARGDLGVPEAAAPRSEEHTSELQSLMRISYAVFCLKKKKSGTHRTCILEDT